MTKRHELHCYDYVNQPYEEVKAALLADPQTIFKAATSKGAETAAKSELRVHLGALELATEIDIQIDSTQPARSPIGKPAYSLSLAWSSPRRPGWFPTMQATLTMYALTPTETQLDFDGIYQPPLGIFGAAVDAVAMHKFAEAAVSGFIQEVAAFLRNDVSRRRAAGAATAL